MNMMLTNMMSSAHQNDANQTLAKQVAVSSRAQKHLDAQSNIKQSVDLHQWLVSSQDQTSFMRVVDAAMSADGIVDGDVVVVERGISPDPQQLVVAIIDGQMMLRRFIMDAGQPVLRAANANFPDIRIQGDSQLVCWGIVVGVARRYTVS